MEVILQLILFMPLMSAILNGVFCQKFPKQLASIISSVVIVITACFTLIIFYQVGIKQNIIHIILTHWFNIHSFNIRWAIYVDQLTAIMMLLITLVSAVVHIYSLGYMSKDKNLAKFLSYLSLFTFFMLALICADNFLQLFFGWEGVGLCSYLLIGYYYQKSAANHAAIKAFMVNRVGDFALIIGIIMIALYTGTLDFQNVFTFADSLSQMEVQILGNNFIVLDIICLMLFIGCMGKSAQIGMHIWLPDAMEGPTPVSALIHSATMVTAGVFLVVRCSFIFEYSPLVLQFMTVIGGITCLSTALVALTQTDIKKIIAYSTCSQLGYMFIACGVSAYHAGIFHLITHGFFKSLLFLSAGNIIYSVNEQDILKMGGLRSKLPITYANFWIGSLAIIGIFPFSGFYSKDVILESAYMMNNSIGLLVFILGTVTAILTALYSLKIIIMTFHGKTRMNIADFEHIRELPTKMQIPLLILATGTLFSGMVGYYILNIVDCNGFFAGSIFYLKVLHHNFSIGISVLPLISGISGIIFGIYIYKDNLLKKTTICMNYCYLFFKDQISFDLIVSYLFIKTTTYVSRYLSRIDNNVIDRFGPNGLSIIVYNCSQLICRIHTGYIFHYVFYIVLVTVLFLTLGVTKYLFWSLR